MQIERTAHAKRTKSTSQKTATQKAKPKKAASKPPVSKKAPRKSGVGKTIKDKTIMVASILCSVVLIAVMVFNAPIIAYKKIDANGTTVSNISIVKYIKQWQPLVELEGTLQKPAANNSAVLDLRSDLDSNLDDGLDLSQIVEGQYTILFLGMDESGELSDVDWLFQFNLLAGTLLSLIHI